jgi:pimeloyl-ACP methyl ester carboxylesterase
MFIKRIGGGPLACFAIPGWGEDHRAFTPLHEYIDGIGELYAVDPPGYGGSPAPPRYEIGAVAVMLAQAYEESCRQAGRRLGALVGNCSGAILAAELALILSPPPARLIFIDPYAFLPGYFRLFLRKGYGKAAYRSTFANPLGRWITNKLLRGRRDRRTDMLTTFSVANHETTYRYLQLFASLSGIDRYAPLTAEVRIITGGQTFAAVRKSIGLWRELWPAAQVIKLASAGHLPIREATGELAAAIFELPTDGEDGAP